MSRGVLWALLLSLAALPIALFSFVLLIHLTPVAIVVALGARIFGGLTELRQVGSAPRSQWQGPDWWWEQAGISPTGQPLTQRATQEPP